MGRLSTIRRACYKVRYLTVTSLSLRPDFAVCVGPPGQTVDSALSEVGLQQAEAAGVYLKDVKFNSVFVSDMLRAKQVGHFHSSTTL